MTWRNTAQSSRLYQCFNVIHTSIEFHILYIALTMENWPLRFQRPNISFTNGNKQDVHSIPELIDFNAKFNAKHTFCIQAEKALLEDSPSFTLISYAKLKHTIWRCAEWLKSCVQELVLPELTEDGAGSRKGPPIGLLLDSDINLLVHMYTLMSLGVPVSKM